MNLPDTVEYKLSYNADPVARRGVLALTAFISTPIIAGCVVDTPYGDKSPQLLFVRVNNHSEKSVTVEIRISNRQSEVVWEDTLKVSPEAQERRDTDLTGKRYDVAVTVNPESETGGRQYQDEWQWGGCKKDAFHIEIADSEVMINPICYDD